MENELRFENTLERLLDEGMQSEAARPLFYRELLHSSVLVCPHGAIEESNDPEKKTTTLRIEAITLNEIPHIPFFLAEKFLPNGVRYITLPARQFFEITKGSYLVLNPGAKVVKTFLPIEVERLLSGQLLDVEKTFEVKKSTEILIGKPKEPPTRLLEQLTRFFSTDATVLRAWMAWYHNPQNEKDPGFLLAIETSRAVDFRSLAGMVSLVLKEVGTGGPYCDVVQYTGNDLTSYFRSDQPFYSKPFWVRMRKKVVG